MLINPATRQSLGLAITDSPVFATVKLSGLADNTIPVHTSDAVGLADSVITQDAAGIHIGSTTAGMNLDVEATLGSELITAPMVTGGWTLGFDTGGWTISGGVLTKTASTAALTATAVSGMTSAPTIGVTYEVVITASATSGAITYTLGGVAGRAITATTITDYITAATAAKLIVSGAIAGTATITSISVKALTDATGDLTVKGNLKIGSSIQSINNINAITVAPNGNVGIGTTTPVSLVDVRGDSAFYIVNSGTPSLTTTAPNGLYFSRNGYPALYLDDNGSPKTNNIIQLYQNETEFGIRQLTNAGGVGADMFHINYDGNVGIGTTVPTAVLHLKAGTATASTAPLKFTSGPVLTAAEAGTWEYLTNQFYLRLDGLTILSDTLGLIVGAGSDMSMIYNGTAGVINTSLIAASDLNISCGADKTLVLTETVWDELPPVPIIAARLGATAPTLATFVGNVEQYTFDATNDYVIGATEITHQWKEGTVIYPHIHWATNGTNANDRGVKWSLEYTIGDSAETFAGAATTVVDVTIPLATADRTHIKSEFASTIDGANYRIGAYICWRLSRTATAHANGAPAADPFGIAVGFHVEQDTIGSRTISAK